MSTLIERAVERHNTIKGEHGDVTKAHVVDEQGPMLSGLCRGTAIDAHELVRLAKSAAQQMVTGLLLAGMISSGDGGETVTIPPPVLMQIVSGVFFDAATLGARIQIESEADAA